MRTAACAATRVRRARCARRRVPAVPGRSHPVRRHVRQPADQQPGLRRVRDACAAGKLLGRRLPAHVQAGLTECGGMRQRRRPTTRNCGTCGKSCLAGEVCSAGTCQLSCQAGLTNCGGTCVNLETDNENCGACGTGAPRASCSAGRARSRARRASRLRRHLRQRADRQPNCGACGTLSGRPGLPAGTCATTCQAGLTNCSGTCVNEQTDNANCRTCGNVCPAG